MNFKDLTFTIIASSVFIIAMILWISGVQTDNNVTENIMSDSRMSALNSSLNANLSTFQDIAQTQRTAFEQDNPLLAFGSFVFQSIIGVGRVLTSVIVLGVNSVFIFLQQAIGIPPLVTGALMGIIIITAILSAWRLYRQGD